MAGRGNPLIGFALSMIERNPNIKNNPQAQTMIDAIRTGDNVRGEQIANNICQSYGVSKDDAISRAKSFFGV